MNTPNDMNKSNHTELPWVYRRLEDKHLTEIGAGHFEDMWCGFRIGEVFSHSDAALIVHRVNNWDKLVEALEFYAYENNWKSQQWVNFYTEKADTCMQGPAIHFDQGNKAKQALKLAKEGI